MSAEPRVVGTPAAPAQRTWRVPFNVVDEVVHLLDTEAAPWSVQLEARVTGSLDEGRLRDAVASALSRHPMARARKAPSRRTRHRDSWEIPPVASDGFGAVRILRSVARAYNGAADPVPDVDVPASRDLVARMRARDTPTRVRRYLALAEKLRDVVAPPARLAAEQASDEPGYGFHHVRLSLEETQRLQNVEHPGSLNDVLLAALHLATADWNERHGVRGRRVAVLVPANLRPPAWREENVGNFSLPARTSTHGRHRASPAAALAAVTRQTARKKRSGMGTGLLEVLGRSHLLPLWAKQALVGLIPLAGDRLVDTAILSNLGRVDDPPWFGDDAGETVELWFSAPARMPLGLSIGAVSTAGCLHLAFRYRHRLFGRDAASRFARCYLDRLLAFASPVPVETV